MTIVIVLVALTCVGVGLRWRKLRRDARRRHWNNSNTMPSVEGVDRIRIVGPDHHPTEPVEHVKGPRLDATRDYVFGDIDSDATLLSGASEARDKALARAGRRRRHSRVRRRRL